jgi:hypothetical protein
MSRFKLRVTRSHRGYVLQAELRRVQTEWSSTTSVIRRHYKKITAEQRSSETALEYTVASFGGDVSLCARAVLPCPVHHVRSIRTCMKRVRSEADWIVRDIRGLRESIEATVHTGGRQGA